MVTFISNSPRETELLGEQWARLARPGLVIGLTGDLGAGKTCLVRGLARGLGIKERIQSPTFSLVNVHPGTTLTLYHLDLYRLDTPAQVMAAGLEEYLEPKGVTVIEWVERWWGGTLEPEAAAGNGRTALGPLFRQVWIRSSDANQREIVYDDIGA